MDAVLLSLAVSSLAIVLRLSLFHSCLLKIRPLFFSLYQRVTNRSITQNLPTKVLGSYGFHLFPFNFLSLLSYVGQVMNLSLMVT